MEITSLIANIFALFLASLFVVSGAHKLAAGNRSYYENVLIGYGFPPLQVLTISVRALGAVEIVIALALLLPAVRLLGAIGALALILVYVGLVGWQVLRGQSGTDCGCGGPAGEMKVGMGLLCRNLLLIGMAGCVLVGEPGSGLAFWLLSVVAACFLALMNASGEQLIGNSQKLRTLRLSKA